jgi:branched-subunit amino acid transport protein
VAEWSALAVLVVGALATQMWRWLGVALGGRIAPGGRAFEWAGCVAYALLAALIVRLIVFPAGPLLDVPLDWRLAAAGIALLVYILTERNLLAGVAVGAIAIAVLGSL